MWRRSVGLLLIVGVSLATAFACKRSGEEITDDEKPPRPKKKFEPPWKKTTEPKSHRTAHATCSSADTPPAGTVTFGPRLPVPLGPACKSKADCKEQANGRCSRGHCTYDRCYDDKDCDNKVCLCDEEGTRGYYCKAGDCAVDSDCGDNGYCSPSYGMSCGAFTGVIGYYCHTEKDECTNDDECVKGKEQGYCAYDSKLKHWRCGYGHCVG
jgi:hypothetical protein